MGMLQNIYEFYRENGLLSTLVNIPQHVFMHARRILLLTIWRVRKYAAIHGFETPIRFHANTQEERHGLWWLQKHEVDYLEKMIESCGSNDVFFDIGANIGFYTCTAAVLTDSEIHAFEPHPGNVQRIKQNLSLNDANATVHELALGATNGESEFATKSPDRPGFGFGVVTENPGPDKASEEITVCQRSATKVVESGDAPQPTVVKIDVEGFEGKVLDGMTSLIESSSLHTIFLEIHNPAPHRLSIEDFGSSEEEILSRLRDWGFTIDSGHPDAPEHHLVATR